MGTFIRTIIFIAAALLIGSSPSTTSAQTYPSRPIHIVTPYSPGGSADMIARLIADNLAKRLGQPVIVENRPGASGTMGTQAVAKAAPDGYTLLLAFVAEVAIAPGLYPKLSYDPLKDLVPVILAAKYPMVLVVTPSLGAASVKDLMAIAKASPQGLAYASSGSGSPAHIAFELLARRTGMNMTHVPYKGGGAALADLLGGHVQMFFSGLSPALPHLKSGKLRAIAVSSAQRSFALPDVPTVSESGVTDFDVNTWNGLFAPAGTPAGIVDQLNTEVSAILRMPDVAKRLASEGAEFAPNTPKEFGAFVQSQVAKYSQVIKDANIKAD